MDAFSLEMLERRFAQLDSNHDGVLELGDVQAGSGADPDSNGRTGDDRKILEQPPVRNVPAEAGAHTVLFMGFLGIPVFFIMMAFAYAWATVNWLQCAAAVISIVYGRMTPLVTALLIATLLLQVACMVATVFMLCDAATVTANDAFAVVSTFGFPHVDSNAALLQAHIMFSGLPHFRYSAMATYWCMLVWLCFNFGLTARFGLKLRRAGIGSRMALRPACPPVTAPADLVVAEGGTPPGAPLVQASFVNLTPQIEAPRSKPESSRC